MNHLTDEQVEIITNRISQNSILSAELKDDLIDHFCCIIEEELKNGVDFSEAYDKAYNETCPNGFEDIQRETIFLINEKN